MELRRLPQKLAGAALPVTLALLAFPAGAAAHVALSPDRVAPHSFTLFSVLSPNESDQPLTGLRLVIPEGVDVDAVADTPGFTTQVIDDQRHRIAGLSWQGGRVPPERLALFRFAAAVSGPGTLHLTGVQTFADGSTRTWQSPEVTVAGEGSGRDALTLGLAVAALVVALAAAGAVAVELARRRRAAG